MRSKTKAALGVCIVFCKYASSDLASVLPLRRRYSQQKNPTFNAQIIIY